MPKFVFSQQRLSGGRNVPLGANGTDVESVSRKWTWGNGAGNSYYMRSHTREKLTLGCELISGLVRSDE